MQDFTNRGCSLRQLITESHFFGIFKPETQVPGLIYHRTKVIGNCFRRTYLHMILLGIYYQFGGTMRIALYQPDIPQNSGTILRLAACLGVAVDVIGPAGFDFSDRALKRAALDYLPYVDLTRHVSFEEFQNQRNAQSRLILLTTKATQSYADFSFQSDDILLLGRESKGVPQEVHETADQSLCIPMRPELRSLNVAVAASMVLGEALKQLKQFPV